MMEVLNVVAIIVAGLMVGSELAVAMFVHPTLDKLPDDVHLPVASALARVQGTIHAFLVHSCPFAHSRRTCNPMATIWPLTNLDCYVGRSYGFWRLLYSVTALVPINNRLKSNPLSDWKTYRHRWDLLHRWRVMRSSHDRFRFSNRGTG